MSNSVEPVLSSGTLDYLRNLKTNSERVKKSDVTEYIQHAINDGDEEIFANFIAIIDRLKRDDPIFKKVTKLHIEATKNEAYRKLHRDASDKKTGIFKLAMERLNWNKANIVKDFTL